MHNDTTRILVLGVIAMVAGAGCGGPPDPEPKPEPEAPFETAEATLADVNARVKMGTLSCHSLAETYQGLHDDIEPTVHAILTWNADILADADRLDGIPAAMRGPLHCAPTVLKDNIDYAGLPTSGGASALKESIATNHSEIAKRLVDAGALVLGKTNMPDFAVDGINTLSSLGGQTPNPYNLQFTIYGSSGGTAAAIAASLGIVGLGTDTYGSLLHPASAGGLVTIRPTEGLISTTGVLPLSTLQDTAGPMTRTVEDAAATLEVLVDNQFAGQGSQEYTKSLLADGLKGLKIGFDPALLQEIPQPPLKPSQEVVDLFDKTRASLEAAGATLKQVNALFPLFGDLQNSIGGFFQCLPVDFKEGINDYLKVVNAKPPMASLSDIIASGGYIDSVDGFLKGAEAQTESRQQSMACQQYLMAKAKVAESVTAMLDTEGLDLFVYPAANQPAFPYAMAMPPDGWFGFQALSSSTGLPSLSMPMGNAASGVPVGLVFAARKYQESKLVQAAFAFQTHAKPRTVPTKSP